MTDDGTEHRADLVVDAGGRRSAVPAWLDARRRPSGRASERDDCGFVVLRPALPVRPTGPCRPSSGRRCKRTSRCPRSRCRPTTARGASGSSPAHATPRSGGAATSTRGSEVRPAVPTGRALDRRRADHRRRGDGRHRGPSARLRRRRCPSGHRPRPDRGCVGVYEPVDRSGCTIGLMHAEALRDLVREHDLADALGFALAWDDMTREPGRAVRAGDPPLRPSPSRRDRGAPRGSPVRDRRRGVAARRGVRRRPPDSTPTSSGRSSRRSRSTSALPACSPGRGSPSGRWRECGPAGAGALARSVAWRPGGTAARATALASRGSMSVRLGRRSRGRRTTAASAHLERHRDGVVGADRREVGAVVGRACRSTRTGGWRSAARGRGTRRDCERPVAAGGVPARRAGSR